MLVEIPDRAGAKGKPCVRPLLRNARELLLVDDEGLDGEILVRLNHAAFRETESMGVLQDRSRIINASAEVGRRSHTVLQCNAIVTTPELRACMPNANSPTSDGWDLGVVGSGAALGERIVVPEPQFSIRSLDVVEARIEHALRIGAIVRDDVFASAGKVGDRSLREFTLEPPKPPDKPLGIKKTEVFDAFLKRRIVPPKSTEFVSGKAGKQIP